MSEPTVLIVILCVMVGIALSLLEAGQRRQAVEREQWRAERRDLMDRIQAPSFQAYAGKVIAEKKAEQKEDEQERVEFVS